MQEPGRRHGQEQRACPPVFQLEHIAQDQPDRDGCNQCHQHGGNAGRHSGFSEKNGWQPLEVNTHADVVIVAITKISREPYPRRVLISIFDEIDHGLRLDRFISKEVNRELRQADQTCN